MHGKSGIILLWSQVSSSKRNESGCNSSWHGKCSSSRACPGRDSTGKRSSCFILCDEFLGSINCDSWVFSISIGGACSPSLNLSKSILGSTKISGWIFVNWPNWVKSFNHVFVISICRSLGWSSLSNSVAACTGVNSKGGIAISCGSSSSCISQGALESCSSCYPSCGFFLISRLEIVGVWPIGSCISWSWPSWHRLISSGVGVITHLF